MTAYTRSDYYLNAEIPDIGSNAVGGAVAGQVFLPVPHGGTIVEARCVSSDTISSDTLLICKLNNTSFATMTLVASGSAIGDVTTLPLNKTVRAGDSILLQSNGSTTNTPTGGVSITIRR